jgi:pyruvate formate lyase activating enzyme
MPQLSLLPQRCISCGSCVEACPGDDGPITTATAAEERTRCLRCGACVDACPSEARSMVGREVGVAELIAELDKDRLFYEESGGGVTFSGGEPMLQPDFLLACLEACKARGYHTVVDTCGYAPRTTLLNVAEHADLFLFDLKLMDATRHEQCVGVSNALILDNLRVLCERGVSTWICVPLIPTLNDDAPNLDALGEFVGSLPGPPPVHVVPYHRIGTDKYDRMGAPYGLRGLAPPTSEHIADVAGRLRAHGLIVEAGGS